MGLWGLDRTRDREDLGLWSLSSLTDADRRVEGHDGMEVSISKGDWVRTPPFQVLHPFRTSAVPAGCLLGSIHHPEERDSFT